MKLRQQGPRPVSFNGPDDTIEETEREDTWTDY
jgi:hypothetical protein